MHESTPEIQTPEATGPLKGLKVIELGVLLAGPVCGQILGDLGADVIKIEAPGAPDPLREWGRVKKDGKSLWFPIVGRNKRCITLNLRNAAGQDIFRSLVKDADIVVENFRPGTMEKWGLGPDALHKINPGLIMVRVSGYGQTGPYASKAGYASVGEAMGGLRYVMGEPDRLPSRAGISLGDTLAAMMGVIGALAALENRRRTGAGQVVDSAIYEACLTVMESLIPEYQQGGHIRERSGSILPGVSPSNIYESSDGMLIIAANQDSVWKRLAQAMGQPELAEDPRYVTHTARGEHQAELDERINKWSRTMTSEALEAACEENGVPCGRILRAPEMLEHPQFKAREAIIKMMHPEIGEMAMQNVFPKFSETPGNVRWTAPEVGAHNVEILGEELGISRERLEELSREGVI